MMSSSLPSDAATTWSLGQLLEQGGATMYPLYLCSLLGALVAVNKGFELWHLRLTDFRWFEQVLAAVRASDFERARSACVAARNPASEVTAAMLETADLQPDHVEAEAQRVGSRVLQRLENHLGVLEFIARVAPLLGLLGTVLGMVDLFMGLQSAGGQQLDIATLASGIWKALLTTAGGLVVAVPVLAAHALLSARIERFRLDMSDSIARLKLLLVASSAGQRGER